MPLKIFLLFLLSPAFGIPFGESDFLTKWDELQMSEINSMEDALRELLEKLRKILKEGIPEEGIPPMEPLHVEHLAMDFYIDNTTLDFSLKDTVIGRLSDFEVQNLTVTLTPKQRLAVGILFPEVEIVGWHRVFGNLFGEIPLDDTGTHRVIMKNATLSVELVLRSKAGTLQVSDLKADFDVQRISVFHRSSKDSNHEKEIPESIVKDILNRIRSLYLPLLLNTGKVCLNDFLLRLKESMDDKNVLAFLGAPQQPSITTE